MNYNPFGSGKMNYSSQKPYTSTPSSHTEPFAKRYAENFNFQTSLALSVFESQGAEQFFAQINSVSALRKVYDSYHAIYLSENAALQIDIRMAKIAYQEARKILPWWFAKFLETIYTKVNKDPLKFKDFLEVFVAYHKFFNPRAN